MDEAVVVEHLPLHGSNSGESQRIAVTAGDLLDSSSHLRLMDAGTDGAVSSQMHLGAQVYRFLYQPQFFLVLVVALADDGLDKRHAGLCRLCGRLHA